ncbi:hypothetical protein [Sphingomonas oryzagri]|uniref:Uncharacterized protein n=1 Tax=Sphingomonas oryzagri TaxID=3042314 RepID=A0ABT6N617_9SPHN|nr:hypothetical protein [Sphingomonas oryzagri]MDH7640535.1 hypothetical protein [Sphingomonas oryzagri]
MVVTTGSLAGYLAGQSSFTTAFQPLDGDLTSLAGASATGALYYRSAAGTWSPVTIGGGLGFSGGTLSNSGLLSGAIGTTVQGYNANLACLSALATSANKVALWTGSGSCSLISASPFGQSLLGAADAPTARGLLGLGSVLCQNAVAASHTGDTIEWTAATCTVPANAMAPNGQIEIVPDWSYTNNSNTKTIRVRFGGTSFASSAYTTSAQGQVLVRIANRNATNSQVGTSAGFATSSGTPTTSAIDTTASVPITLTCQLAVTTDTCTLESYIIKLFPAS